MGKLPVVLQLFFPIGIAISLLVGCDRANISKDSSTQVDDSNNEWLIVSTDPAKLDSAREKAQKLDAKEYADFYKGLTRSAYLDSEDIVMIANRREEVVKRLTQLATSTMAKNQGIGAALVLCRLKEPSGLVRVKEVLRSGSDEQKSRVLNALGMIYAPRTSEDYRTYRNFILGDPELIDLVFRQMNDAKPDVVYAAVQLSGMFKMAGLSERILKVLEKPSELDRGRLVYWLSQGELTEEIFEFAMSHDERVRISTDDHWSGALYEAFAKSTNESWSHSAREILFLKLMESPEKTKGVYTGGRIGMIDTVAETATKEDLPRIRKLAKREHGYYATSLLAAWIRLDPKGGRKTLLQWLGQSERCDVAIDTAAKVYAKTGDREIVEGLRKVSQDLTAQELYSMCLALRAIDGDEANELMASLLPRLQAGQRQYFERVTTQTSIDELLAAVENSGVLPVEVLAPAAAQVRREHGGPADASFAENTSPFARPNVPDYEEELEDDESAGLLEIFLAAKCALIFDAETNEVPCRHDQLLQDFGKASRGLFVPEAVAEEWLRKKTTDDDAPYRVQFIHGGRLYDAEIRNQGDWYDLERLTDMINRALQDAEISERFIALDSESQMATYVFADPARLRPLAEKYHMPLTSDAGEATKTGLEFERAVKQRLGDE